MLTYDMSTNESLSLYDKLYRYIRDDILSGNIRAGEKLPSKRQLATNLGISVITVENAYSQLLAEGYIRSKERSGFYAEKVERRTITPTASVQRKKTEQEYFTKSVETEEFPFSVWAKLMRETLLEGSDRLLKKQPHEGAYELRDAIARYVYRTKGIEASPDQIIIGAGTEYISSLLVQLFGQNSVFGVEDPGYHKTASIYRANGATCVHLPLDKQGIRMDTLHESSVQILHITPTHHFPTGIITPITRRQELLTWAREKNDRYIIEDDYDSEFRFSGRPIPSLRSIDADEKVIYINTFSKTLAPSIRISYMILPRHLLTRYQEKLGFYASVVPTFEQYTLAKFIDRGYFERHLSRMRTYYRKRRDLILKRIDELKYRTKYTVLPADTGLHFLLKAKTEKTDDELVSSAKKQGVNIPCLSSYSVLNEKKYEHFLLLDYSENEFEDLSFLDTILI